MNVFLWNARARNTHVEATLNHPFPAQVAPILTGCTLHFAKPDALKGSLKDTLAEVRPTVFFGVPRVWEKFGEAMKAKAAPPGSLKDKVATFAKAAGTAAGWTLAATPMAPFDSGATWTWAGKGCEIPNFKGSYLGRFPLVSADFWTSDHPSERSRT